MDGLFVVVFFRSPPKRNPQIFDRREPGEILRVGRFGSDDERANDFEDVDGRERVEGGERETRDVDSSKARHEGKEREERFEAVLGW